MNFHEFWKFPVFTIKKKNQKKFFEFKNPPGRQEKGGGDSAPHVIAKRAPHRPKISPGAGRAPMVHTADGGHAAPPGAKRTSRGGRALPHGGRGGKGGFTDDPEWRSTKGRGTAGPEQ